MSGEIRNRWGAKRGAMLGVQAFAYVVFVLIGVAWGGFTAGSPDSTGGATAVPAAVAGAMIVPMLFVLGDFHMYWPFRATLVDRAIGLIAGALSIVCAASPLLSIYGPSDVAAADPLKLSAYPMASWAAAVAGLLVVLTIVSFGRQMARENRSHLIRALSHCVTGGAASISLAGWAFLPYVTIAGRASFAGASGAVGVGAFLGVVALMVLFALVLAVASVWWLGELDPDPAARHPWMGVAMLPVMFYGLVVFAAALFLQLI